MIFIPKSISIDYISLFVSVKRICVFKSVQITLCLFVKRIFSWKCMRSYDTFITLYSNHAIKIIHRWKIAFNLIWCCHSFWWPIWTFSQLNRKICSGIQFTKQNKTKHKSTLKQWRRISYIRSRHLMGFVIPDNGMMREREKKYMSIEYTLECPENHLRIIHLSRPLICVHATWNTHFNCTWIN